MAIAAHKGGVGKTTTALGLGAGLARTGAHVLLIDLDPQGCATRGLFGGDVDYRAPGTADLFCDAPLAIAKLARETAVPGLSMLLATGRLDLHARWLVTAARVQLLTRALDAVRDRFAWILIDCPPSLGPLIDVALAAATDVIIPVRMEARARDSLVDVLNVLRTDHPALLSAYRVLVTQFDRRDADLNAGISAQLAQFAAATWATVIPRSVALNKAQAAGVDMFAFAGKSAGARAYLDLCEEVRQWPERSIASNG